MKLNSTLFYTSGRNKVNKNYRGMLYGMCFGDGGVYITKDQSKKTARIVIGHTPKQRKYLEYKNKLLHSIFGGKISKINTYISLNKKMNKEYTNIQLCRTEKYFRQMHRVLYPKGKKIYTRKSLYYLTDEGLALWFCDDGNGRICTNPNGKIGGCMTRISTYCSLKEIEIIRDWFKEKYDLNVKFDCDKRNNLYSVRFNTKDSHKFVQIVQKYVPKSMRYKLEHTEFYNTRAQSTLP